MASKKYYGVRAGRAPGVYTNWLECKAQIDGYPNAIFKGFPSEAEARAYVAGLTVVQQVPDPGKAAHDDSIDIYVDGSYAQEQYSWAFVAYKHGKVFFSDNGVGTDSEAGKMRNVAGELKAAVQAIAWAEANNLKPITIHHDYMGIAAWAEKSWQAKNKFTQSYAAYAAARLSWIKFNKVAGHSGIEGNELADKLASEALQKWKNSNM